MGQNILILGESGTGKTTSLRNFKADEIKLIKVVSKNLPFKGHFEDTVTSDNYATIIEAIKNSNKKAIVIDDTQYIMSNEFFRRCKETGWDKFNDIGSNFYKLLHAADNLPEDVFVYYLSHTQRDSLGKEKMKTIGQMLDDKLTIEGLCTVVLKTVVVDGVYSFQTQNSGQDTCKSPVGMFSSFLIDNDLKMVDSIMREYWGYTDTKVKEKSVSQEGPSLKNPKVKATEEAKSRKLKEAPIVQSSNEKAQSEENQVKEAQGFSVPVTSVKEQATEEEIKENDSKIKENKSKEAVGIPVPSEKKEEKSLDEKSSKEDKLAAIREKLAAIKAAQNR